MTSLCPFAIVAREAVVCEVRLHQTFQPLARSLVVAALLPLFGQYVGLGARYECRFAQFRKVGTRISQTGVRSSLDQRQIELCRIIGRGFGLRVFSTRKLHNISLSYRFHSDEADSLGSNPTRCWGIYVG